MLFRFAKRFLQKIQTSLLYPLSAPISPEVTIM
jgi:hypothetical protein